MSKPTPTDFTTTLPLFGGPLSWSSTSWTTVDDRVRGGSSISSLTINSSTNSATFSGNLDTKTLGGAGFASQFASKATDSEKKEKIDNIWDLAAYDGIEIEMGSGDGKTFTFILKDEVPEDRGDGRMGAGLSFEAKFEAPDTTSAILDQGRLEDGKVKKMFLAWKDFKPFYRGKEVEGKELKKENVARVGLMMRSYFGGQEGSFEVEISSVKAVAGWIDGE